jgi:hypothetical protein
MDFENLTDINKTDIKDVVNCFYGTNIITSIFSTKLNNSTLIIYQDKEKKTLSILIMENLKPYSTN